MQVESLYLEIVKQLEKKADAKLAKIEKYYHKTPGHRSYGIRTPEFRALSKQYKSCLKQLSLDERVKLARMFFKSGFSEQASFGNMMLELSIKDIELRHLSFLDEVAGYLSNWGTTDGFCIGTIQPILRKYPEETLKLLRKWNSSESLWKRRASVVVFTRKIGESGDFTDDALELCNNLIWDKEDMVRKGVGWALKDTMRGDKKRVLDYVKSLRQKGVSAVITLYAIRDLKGKKREEVLNIKPK